MKNNFSKKSTTYFSIFFSSSRALRCVRNEIHTHLFVASILHNASWLLWYGAVIYRFDTIHMWTVWNSQFCYLFNAPLLILTCILQDDERVACIALHILIHYFMVATYMWMLAEGMNDFMIHFFFQFLCLRWHYWTWEHVLHLWPIIDSSKITILGLYLYIVLVVTFVSEKRVKQGLYMLGWGLPFLVILAYLIARGAFSSGEENM